ncbi:MAG: hypothetical protein AB7G93_15525 [Bdellovibrionales bacterium]
MKAQLGLLLATIAVSGFAQATPNPTGASSWELIYESSERASGPDGFEILRAKYPTLFDGSPAPGNVAKSAQVSSRLYVFRGEHSCQENDPRLRYESQSYGMCEESADGNGPASCFQSAQSHPGSHDPCFQL